MPLQLLKSSREKERWEQENLRKGINASPFSYFGKKSEAVNVIWRKRSIEMTQLNTSLQ